MAFHPRCDTLVLAAADKGGHVGLWHVDRDACGDAVFGQPPAAAAPGGTGRRRGAAAAAGAILGPDGECGLIALAKSVFRYDNRSRANSCAMMVGCSLLRTDVSGMGVDALRMLVRFCRGSSKG